MITDDSRLLADDLDLSASLDTIDETELLAEFVVLTDDELRAVMLEANETIALETTRLVNAGALLLYRRRQRQRGMH